MVVVSPVRLRPTAVYDTFWRFAAERQRMLMRRVRGDTPPWSADPVLVNNRFTNAYRAADRVSQYLINHVIPACNEHPADIFLRVLLFKIFNRISTWELVEHQLGPIHIEGFDPQSVDAILSKASAGGARLYSPAYVMPSPMLGHARKHTNHLWLLANMLRERLGDRIAAARSMAEAYGLLLQYPSVGPFLAFQWLIDLNYSNLCDFSEMDFVVAGPGALSGIRKCFINDDSLAPEETIRYVADQSELMFSRLDLTFATLWGRALQLVDIQNLFCEVDKYARVAHPEVAGTGSRTRIKQRYRVVNSQAPIEGFPPSWKLPTGRVKVDGFEVVLPGLHPGVDSQ